MKLLLVEDDTDLAKVLQQLLELQKYKVTIAKNGRLALDMLKKDLFDLCILDVMLPELDGFSVAKEIKSGNINTAFLFVTAKNLQEDKLLGLRLGAEDYITKPFNTDEFLLRIKNCINRKKLPIILETIKIANYVLNSQRNTLKTENEILQLTEKEATLLQYLFTHRNQLLKREQILHAVWHNSDFFSGRSMDVYLSKLRKYFANNALVSIEVKRNIGLEFKIKTE